MFIFKNMKKGANKTFRLKKIEHFSLSTVYRMQIKLLLSEMKFTLTCPGHVFRISLAVHKL